MIEQWAFCSTEFSESCEQLWFIVCSITMTVVMFVYGVISGSKKMIRKERVFNDVMIASSGFAVGAALSFLVPVAFLALVFLLPPFICMKILAALTKKRINEYE